MARLTLARVDVLVETALATGELELVAMRERSFLATIRIGGHSETTGGASELEALASAARLARLAWEEPAAERRARAAARRRGITFSRVWSASSHVGLPAISRPLGLYRGAIRCGEEIASESDRDPVVALGMALSRSLRRAWDARIHEVETIEARRRLRRRRGYR